MVMLKSSCKAAVFQGYWNSCRDFPYCAMSRCFPFPPPGYEKKSTTNDIDLLKKEKHKEKKHKKDKKDKEKREGKEKREERSDGKHKEKKEKKDKHRDKKKDKEKRVEGQFSHNGETFHHNNEHNKQRDSSLGHKKSSLQQLQNGEHKVQLKENCSTSNDKKSQGQNSKNKDMDSSKFVQELNRRIRDDEKRTGTLQFPVESRKVSVDRRVEDKGQIRDKQFHEKQKNKDRTNGEKVKEKTELLEKNKYMKNNLSTHSPNVGSPCASGDIKKRKDTRTNGFSHENEPRPNKIARTTTILRENGRKEDLLENPRLSQPGKQGPLMVNSFKVDSKERKYNGVIASQPMSIFPKKPPIPTKPTPTRSPPVSTNHIAAALPPPPPPPLPYSKKKRPAEPRVRPPHPDSKYLKKILTVPKLDQWSGLDEDQEWLLSRKVDTNNTHFKKTLIEEVVWSEAKHLELIDICALPYVIPL